MRGGHRVGRALAQRPWIFRNRYFPPVPPPPPPTTAAYTPAVVLLCLAGAAEADATDTFQRGDGPLLQASSGQPWWFFGTGATTIISGSAAYDATSTGPVGSVVRSLSNGTITVPFTTLQNGAGIVFRCADTIGTTYWLLTYNAGSTRYDVSFVEASGTVDAVGHTTGVTPANGDVVTVTTNADAITVAVNGTARLALTGQDEATTSIYAGLWFPNGATTARFASFAATRNWLDVSARVRFGKTGRGYQQELGRPEYGDASIIFDNTDRAFDRTNTASPYYPNIKPYRQLKVQAVMGGVTYPRWTGYVERWTPQIDSDGKYAFVTATGTDILAQWVAQKLSAIYYRTVRASVPTGYFRFGDTPPVVRDAGPNATVGHTATAGITRITPGLNGSPDDNGAVIVPDGEAVTIDVSACPASLDSDFTVEFLFSNASGTPGGFVSVGGSAHSGDVLEVGVCAGQSARAVNVRIRSGLTVNVISTDGNATSGTVGGQPHYYDDGIAHHCAVVVTGGASKSVSLYIDGFLVAQKTNIGAFTQGACVGAFAAGDTGGQFTLDELALYSRALAAADLHDHGVAAGIVPRTGDTTGSRLNYLLDLLDFPASQRRIAAGTEAVQPQIVVADKPFEHLQKIDATEDGWTFIDGDGTLVFYDRHTVIANGNVLGDAHDGFELPYTSGFVADDDPTKILNEVRVTRDSTGLTDANGNTIGGGSEVSIDAESQIQYLVRSHERTTVHATDDAAQRLADRILDRYSVDKERVEACTVDIRASGDPTLCIGPQVFGIDISERVLVKQTPVDTSGTATPLRKVFDERVIRIEDEFTPGTWYVHFMLEPT